MSANLTAMLVTARVNARANGDAYYTEEIAPGVMRVEAELAAWHARAVQGGYTTVAIEAERLSADRGGVAP